MDSSCSDMDVSLSPTQVLERLQVLRQLQLMQRGKLQRQQLQYSTSPRDSSSITEFVSKFTSSTSYNSVKSLLQITHERSFENVDQTQYSPRLQNKDLIDGVSVLNLSQESEFVIQSPISNDSRSLQSISSDRKELPSIAAKSSPKQIILDEMPIIAPKKDFHNLLLEKLQNDKSKVNKVNNDRSNGVKPKPYLKRGEGMSRFGLKKKDIVIQSTNSLPWKKNGPKKDLPKLNNNKDDLKLVRKGNKGPVQMTVHAEVHRADSTPENRKQEKRKINKILEILDDSVKIPQIAKTNRSEIHANKNVKEAHNKSLINDDIQTISKKDVGVKYSLPKGKTWAAILTKEQDDFLKQLKQSDYYRNFGSPAKSTISDISYDEASEASLEREVAEQNLFELLEKKAKHGSFNLNNSFINKFLKSNLECSGESTPLVFKKCLSDNPHLLNIHPPPKPQVRPHETQSDMECEETDCTNCQNCDEDTNSMTSSSCSCKTVEDRDTELDSTLVEPKKTKEVKFKKDNDKQNSIVNDEMKTNMVEMNAKLVATSDLLKDRLQELEDEIATFRKENANLNKMREELDLERQKFYEEKSNFEQKYNEEKILAEYYLAEEKEKLSKQKLTYDRYVREMRGRLNKKDKEEVVLLKKEINDLKEEIRLKDAKTTTTTARLRNQLKIMEKEKKDLEAECEKLKKENRRIQHSNETTRRLTNIKYLENINRKLTNMSSRETKSEIFTDNDMKYKSYEIEKQCKNIGPRKRAKSVPNLNVTSRYAKYFSQRDASSEIERHYNINVERTPNSSNIEEKLHLNLDNINSDNTDSISNISEDETERNNLERIYTERFGNTPPDVSIRNRNSDNYFLQNSTSSLEKERSKSPVSILSNRSKKSPEIVKDPTEYKKADGSKELRFANGNVKYISADGTYSKFTYYNGDIKETFYSEGRIKYYYAENKTYHTTHSDGLEVLEFADGQVEKRYKDGSSEVRLPNGSVRYNDPKNTHVREEWRFADGTVLTVTANGEQFVRFPNGQVEVHALDHKRREFPDGTVKLVYKDGTSETRYSSGRIRVKDKAGQLIMDSHPTT